MDPSTDETIPERTLDASTAQPPSEATDEPDGEPETFDAAYVRKLRREASDRRRDAKEAGERVAAQEAELGELRAWRLDRTIADANLDHMAMRRLADPSDLLAYTDPAALVDDAGNADPAKITAAIDALLERKPHLAAGYGRVGGAWGGSEGGRNPTPTPSIGALIGRAARGERDRG